MDRNEWMDRNDNENHIETQANKNNNGMTTENKNRYA